MAYFMTFLVALWLKLFKLSSLFLFTIGYCLIFALYKKTK